MSRQRSQAVCLVVLMAAGLAGLVGPSANAQTATPAPVRKPVIVVLTSGASEMSRYMMALNLAGSALDAGREVAVYLDVNAPELARRDKSNRSFVAGRRTGAGRDVEAVPAPQKMLGDLMVKGAKVYVCPACLKYEKITLESLLEGITVLTNKELLEMSVDATVLSY